MAEPLPAGMIEVERAMLRPDARLFWGCDRTKFFTLIGLGVPALALSVARLWLLPALGSATILIAGVYLLKKLGKNPFHFPLLDRNAQNQKAYRRSSPAHLKPRGWADQQRCHFP